MSSIYRVQAQCCKVRRICKMMRGPLPASRYLLSPVALCSRYVLSMSSGRSGYPCNSGIKDPFVALLFAISICSTFLCYASHKSVSIVLQTTCGCRAISSCTELMSVMQRLTVWRGCLWLPLASNTSGSHPNSFHAVVQFPCKVAASAVWPAVMSRNILAYVVRTEEIKRS